MEKLNELFVIMAIAFVKSRSIVLLLPKKPTTCTWMFANYDGLAMPLTLWILKARVAAAATAAVLGALRRGRVGRWDKLLLPSLLG